MTEAKQPASPDVSSTTPTTVLLIRHGQNEWVKRHKLAGLHPGVHLDKRGQREARAVGRRLVASKMVLHALYAGPLERTIETARGIAEAVNLPVIPCPGLTEVDCGDWTNQNLADLAQTPLWPVIQHYPSNAHFPNGESLYEMQTRAVHTINQLVGRHPGQTIVLVSHADIIKSAVAHYLGMHLDMFQRITISPASITTIIFTGMRPVIQTLNDVSHLPALPPSKS